MKKILGLWLDVCLVLFVTLGATGISALGGFMALNGYTELTLPLMENSLLCAILTCQVIIGIVAAWALQDREVCLWEVVALVLWPSVFYWQAYRLPITLITPLFFVLLIAAFGRIRYHMRKRQAKPLSRRKEAHHIIDGERELNFDAIDANGFGSATDPETQKRYLLNEDTEGYDPKTLGHGQRFKGFVTHAQYVTQVTQIFS